MGIDIQSGIPTYVEATLSAGSGQFGNRYIYLRPNCICFNKSRRVGGYKDEVMLKAEKVINKWYFPEVKKYLIDGKVIASNNEQNALKEYWRICDYDKINKTLPVELIN